MVNGINFYISNAKSGEKEYEIGVSVGDIPSAIIIPTGTTSSSEIWDVTNDGAFIFHLRYFIWGKKTQSDTASVSYLEYKYKDMEPKESYNKLMLEYKCKNAKNQDLRKQYLDGIKSKIKRSDLLLDLINYTYISYDNEAFIRNLYMRTECLSITEWHALYYNPSFGFLLLSYHFGYYNGPDSFPYEYNSIDKIRDLKIELAKKTLIFSKKEDAILYANEIGHGLNL